MNSISLCSHPEILSSITLFISNYKDASVHISLNCVQRQKRIRVVIGNKYCLDPNTKITPNACDDLQFTILEYPISDAKYLRLLEKLDESGVYRWERKYTAAWYPWSQWKLRISRKGENSIFCEGACCYPEEWEQFWEAWNAFTCLDATIRYLRMRWIMNGSLNTTA